MTQGNPTPPTIFNVVVDAVFRNWVSVVAEAEAEAGTKGFIRDVQRTAAHFYADYGLLVSTRAVKLKQAFHVLKELFDPVGFHTNEGKTVSMCRNILYIDS